ncbi:MAG: hydroxyacid dehydrogenase, partial [Actinobacteria bacterium]|nr:hydroxyacid dehydrogenase [Actinomycetota bacterium]
MNRAAIAIAPEPARNTWLADAVRAGGGTVVDPDVATGLVWAIPKHPERLEQLLATCPNITWVQLPFAGIETFTHLMDDGRTWTCGKGVYADPVAELALSLLLAGMRGVGTYARRNTWQKADANELGHNLLGANVTILGGGGITASLLRLLGGFDVTTTVVRRSVDQPVDGAAATVGLDRLHEVLSGADAVVLALAMTPETRGVIDAAALDAMADHAWL